MLYQGLRQLNPPQFRRTCGVRRETFLKMVEILRPDLNRRGKRGGQNQLSVENQLLLTLQYWREYRTQFHISLDFGVSESTVCRTIAKVETLLVRSRQFRLPGKRSLQNAETSEVVVIDVTEVAIERPQKHQKRYYSGKSKTHVLKAQIVLDWNTHQFLAVACGTGRTHDFQLFKSTKLRLHTALLCLGDKGYQGIANLHANSITPKKKPPNQSLKRADKQANRSLAQVRIKVEHGIRRLKRFRIFSERYRNRRRRFGLRLHLLAGIINFEVELAS